MTSKTTVVSAVSSAKSDIASYEFEEEMDEQEDEEEVESQSSLELESTMTFKGSKTFVSEGDASSSVVTAKAPMSRRMIGEDHKYTLQYIKTLQQTILDQLAMNFGENPIDFGLLSPAHQLYIVDNLSVHLPLQVVTQAVPFESYWKRRCEAQPGRWFRNRDVRQHGGSHKRMFFEWFLAQCVADFIPYVSDSEELVRQFEIGGEFVRRLDLGQLLIAIKGRMQGDLIELDEHGRLKQSPDYGHVNLSMLGSYLVNLESLKIKYRVCGCGLNFDWSMFHCSTSDITNLCRLTAFTPKLTKLSITHSRLDDVKMQILTSCLTSLGCLTNLDLSHNRLANDSARFLARFLIKNPPLRFLNLRDNRIHSEGAMAIFYSLAQNKNLSFLNLNLNLIDSKVASMFVSMAMKNEGLSRVDLSANDLDDVFCEVLGSSMGLFAALKTLLLSSNHAITERGLKSLVRGLEMKGSVHEIELKGTAMGDDVLECLRKVDYASNLQKSNLLKNEV